MEQIRAVNAIFLRDIRNNGSSKLISWPCISRSQQHWIIYKKTTDLNTRAVIWIMVYLVTGTEVFVTSHLDFLPKWCLQIGWCGLIHLMFSLHPRLLHILPAPMTASPMFASFSVVLQDVYGDFPKNTQKVLK